MSVAAYESFFGLVERPFSLTPDPRYFFKSRSHGRAIETLTFALRRRERFLLVTGDLGVGKTMLCRTLVEQLRRRTAVCVVGNPLISVDSFLTLLDDDLGVANGDELAVRARAGAAIVIDQAHALPLPIVDQLVKLTTLEGSLVQIVLIGEARTGESGALGIAALDEHVSTQARLLPLARDECASYVTHRLRLAGSDTADFTQRAIDMLYGLSGGLPRLVNLIGERTLQEAAATGSLAIEPAAVQAAAASLQLLRARPRHFRWFSRRVS